MISSLNEATQDLIRIHPDYQKLYEKRLREDGADEPILGLCWAKCARNLAERYAIGQAPDKDETLNLVERYLTTGDETTQDVVATWFLESLLIAACEYPDGLASLLQSLRPNSLGYCQEFNRKFGFANKGI
jgi:hypothetical protein